YYDLLTLKEPPMRILFLLAKQFRQLFLAKQMTEEELTAALKEIIAEVGATSAKEMGKVMGVASKKLAGKADGRLISEKVKSLLN
ncbi:MAG: GatB/YqeY domain-containing protein, partial [Paludibacteraceae bacterium]|nr:GatB/YqeY domain-containing protein [Paludibacteraceae bacterium]